MGFCFRYNILFHVKSQLLGNREVTMKLRCMQVPCFVLIRLFLRAELPFAISHGLDIFLFFIASKILKLLDCISLFPCFEILAITGFFH